MKYLLPLLLIAAPALAENGGRGEKFLTMWDLDANGAVSQQEAQTHRPDIFAMFDENTDGKIAGAEFVLVAEHQALESEGKGRGQAEAPMQSNDANSDGTVTLEEFVAGTESWFARRDRDGDGAITSADFGR